MLRELAILHFDIENRPLAYLGQDYTTAEITAIAAQFRGATRGFVWALGRDDNAKMLAGFVALYNVADLVTGHYIRPHDLPIINGALLEQGMPPLSAKLTVDTKEDLVKRRYLSASQENLCAMFGIETPKVHMSNADWREANRLTPAGIQKTIARVTGDVRQHMALYTHLVEHDLLTAPKVWSPK